MPGMNPYCHNAHFKLPSLLDWKCHRSESVDRVSDVVRPRVVIPLSSLSRPDSACGSHALELISPIARTSLSRSAIDVYTWGVTRTHRMFSQTMPTV